MSSYCSGYEKLGLSLVNYNRVIYLSGDFDFHLFGEGKHHSIYEKLGAHLTEQEGQQGVYFAVWVPHAQAVGVVGDFNNWDTRQCPMRRNQMGIWEVFVPRLQAGEKYKYAITTK